ncbi:MAG: CHASE4 domain-containing protein [Planctomycetota bacterium]
MSLRSKIVVLLSIVLALYAGIDHLFQKVLIRKKFLSLEQVHADNDLERVRGAIQSELALVERDCEAWASWDDTYDFVSDANEAYVRSNLGDDALHQKSIDLLYVLDASHRIVWGVTFYENSRAPAYGFPTERGQTLPEENPVVAALRMKSAPSGIVNLERGSMLVACRPILQNGGKGEPRGTLIVGRYLGTNLQEELVERTKVNFTMWTRTAGTFDSVESQAQAQLGSGDGHVTVVQDSKTLLVFANVFDILGEPSVTLQATIDRLISTEGDKSIRYALVSTVAAAVLMLLVLLELLQRTVLSPIAKLTKHALYIGKSEELSKKLNLTRQDEIGVLSREFDSMTEKLAQSRAAVVNAARAAGMSEIATGVLHNVGNVLNSVNVSAALVAEKTKNSGISDLRLAMQTVRDSEGDLAAFVNHDPRGKYLYPLLTSLTDQLTNDQDQITQEVRSLTDGIQHIRELIQAQQSYAGKSGLLEVLPVHEVIEKAIQMTAQADKGVRDLEIVREFEELPPCAIDRHRLMEILVNVIQNARQALLGSQNPPRLVVRTRRTDDDRLHIEIEDNGIGIPPENLTKIFNHGFTTKENGHGFGLHSSANAATEMGAALRGHSDGLGQGARFTIDLPYRVPNPTGAMA